MNQFVSGQSQAGADQVPLRPAADPARSRLMQFVKVAQT